MIAAGADVVFFGMGDGSSRDDAGRRDGEAPAGRRRSGSSTSSATSGRSTRRACCSRPSSGTSRPSTRAIKAVNAGTFGTTYVLDARTASRCSRRTRLRPRSGQGRGRAEELPTARSRSSRRPRRRSRSTASAESLHERRAGRLVGPPRPPSRDDDREPYDTAGTARSTRPSSSFRSRRRSRACSRTTASRSRCAAARCTASWARTAPASRRS